MPHSPSQHSLLFARHWVSPDVPTSADFKVSFLNPAFLFLFSAPVLLHSTLRIQSVRAGLSLSMSFTQKSKYFSPHIVHSFPRESRDSISLPIGMLDSLTGIWIVITAQWHKWYDVLSFEGPIRTFWRQLRLAEMYFGLLYIQPQINKSASILAVFILFVCDCSMFHLQTLLTYFFCLSRD